MSSNPVTLAKDPLDDSNRLDALETLPSQNMRSVRAMLFVQAFNAFSDNFVKILLVALAGVVAKGTDVGDKMQLYLAAIFSLPYILFAPVAGWMSDRFSKQKVILWMQILQLVIFGAFFGALVVRHDTLSLQLSLVCFFLLATQSAFFSPAKMGIGKELVGSERLGALSGKLQLTNFMGILGGMGLAGWWFGSLIQDESAWQGATQAMQNLGPLIHGSAAPTLYQSATELLIEASQPRYQQAAWSAAIHLLTVSTGIAVVQWLGAMLIQTTPSHPHLKFHRKIWIEHFDHLKLMWANRAVRLAAMGITFFWFVSNALASMLVTLSHEMHPVDKSAAAKELSMMPAMLGIGVMLGSVVAGWICRKRLEMGLVPLSGLLMALSLFWTGVVPMAPSVYVALILVGAAGGAFMTPLYAYVQDCSKPEERARVLSAINLLDCAGAIVANLVMIEAFLRLEISSATQILLLSPLTLIAAYFMAKFLPQGLLRMVGLLWVKVCYGLQGKQVDRMPKDEAILLLPNHVSYVDTLLLGAVSRRDLRFVMLESMYETPKWKWVFDAFSTIPISPSKAREAMRTVASSLQKGEAVVLFPEGQLSRIGFTNPIRKGYEIMARLGKSRVQVVWLDGVWHSMFAFKGGRVIKKNPERFPLPVSVYFGPVVEAEEATPQYVLETWMRLSAEAFAKRDTVRRSMREPRAVAVQNAMRLDECNAFFEEGAWLNSLPESHRMYETFQKVIAEYFHLHQVSQPLGETVAWITDDTSQSQAYVLIALQQLEQSQVQDALQHCQHLWLYDEVTGALLSASGPSVELKGDGETQSSSKLGSFGRVLPGLAYELEGGVAYLLGWVGHEERRFALPGLFMDEDGYLIPSVPRVDSVGAISA